MTPDPGYLRWRSRLLALRSLQLPDRQTGQDAALDLPATAPLAAVMEYWIGKAVVTLGCRVDDEVTIAFSTGRRLEDYGGHEAVALAAASFLIEADKLQPQMTPVAEADGEPPLPDRGELRLSVVTAAGTFPRTDTHNAVRDDASLPAAGMEGAGQEVIAAAREA